MHLQARRKKERKMRIDSIVRLTRRHASSNSSSQLLLVNGENRKAKEEGQAAEVKCSIY